MLIPIVLVLLAVLFTGFGQVLLKKGSKSGCNASAGFLAPYLNRYTISAYGLLLATTIISVIALQAVPLKLFYAIASLNFVVVAGLSWGLLKEEISGKMLVGIGLIVAGILVFNL
ncbi:MAG: hypothetical protein JXQ82_02785 [Methanomicrobiaceae archaeon]|nr:hypothetical protein [Methanomicrobiaceae archaeon]